MMKKKVSQKSEIFSFNLYLTPGGDVIERSPSEAAMIRRVAGLTELKPGGMIVMSTDVNATSGSKFKGIAKGFLKSLFNRIMRSRRIDEAMKEMLQKEGLDSGWSIGNLFKGRYYSPKSDKTFNEKSFAVDVRGVDFEFVKDVAELLRKKFDQESVLLVNYKNNRTYLQD